jgi:DNA modification methylase
LAAKQLGLRYVGIEKCQEYVEIAKARLENTKEAKGDNSQMEFAI